MLSFLSDDKKIVYSNVREIDKIRSQHLAIPNSYICPLCKRFLFVTYSTVTQLTHVSCNICNKIVCMACNTGLDACICISKKGTYELSEQVKDRIRKIIGDVIDKIIIHKCPKCLKKIRQRRRM